MYSEEINRFIKYKFSTMADLALRLCQEPSFLSGLSTGGRVQGLIDQLVDRRVIGYYVPQIIGGAIVAIVIWTQGKKFINLKYWKYGLAFSLPLIPEALSIQIMNQSDKIMIQKMISNECRQESLHLRQRFLLSYGFLRIQYGMHGFHGFMLKYTGGRKRSCKTMDIGYAYDLEFFPG